MELDQGKLVTWITCRCGHEAVVPYSEWDREKILPRVRCTRCRTLGAVDLRHGFISSANPLDGARVPGKGD